MLVRAQSLRKEKAKAKPTIEFAIIAGKLGIFQRVVLMRQKGKGKGNREGMAAREIGFKIGHHKMPSNLYVPFHRLRRTPTGFRNR